MRNRLLPALAVLLLATSTALSAQTAAGLDSEIRLLQRLAEERYAEGDLVGAAATYEEIAGKQTGVRDQANALFMAAWLTHLSGRQQEALATMTRSLILAPDQPFDPSLYDRNFEILYTQALDNAWRDRRRESAALTREAATDLVAGRDAAARQRLAEAIELDPESPAALYNLALLDLRGGATETAMTDFERVISLTYKKSGAEMTELRARALTSLGITYQRQKLADDAEQAFLEATRTNPQEVSAWTHLGMQQMAVGRPAEAATSLERAHALAPDDPQVTVALATALAATGRTAQAAATLHAALSRRPDDAEMWYQLAGIEQLRQQNSTAIDAAQRAIVADPENRQGVALLAGMRLTELCLQDDDVAAALDAANRAVGWDRGSAEAWTALGHAQTAAGQSAAAAASFGRAAELDPESADRQMTLGDSLAANRQLPQAEAAYLRALTLDPEASMAAEKLETIRSQIASQRAIVSGKARAPKPIAPKKIGLDFAGIDYQDLQLRGALVKQVNKKSPAARAGLRKGDLILWIGDYAVLSGKDFFQYLKRSPPGDRLAIEYLRDGRIHDVELRLR